MADAAPAKTSDTPAAPPSATSPEQRPNANKGDVHHALFGRHRPSEGSHDHAAQHLEYLVERSKDDHESHVGISDVGGVPETSGTDASAPTSLDRLSNVFKSLGCNILPNTQQFDEDLVYYKMGNYVALRKPAADGNDKIFETMPLYVRVGMHLLFHSSKRASLLRFGRVETLLEHMSKREGTIYDDASKPEDVQAFIKNFIKTYGCNVDELLESDLTKYKTRNEFFYRKLKPDVRPIAQPDDTKVIGSAADCRLMVFDNVDEAKRIWIKGKEFSMANLLKPVGEAAQGLTEGSSIAVYRLAPADYHRYHHPVGPVEVTAQHHGGKEYYTVNPDAVNENFDVFTANTRFVTVMHWTPKEGVTVPMAMVSIGALLVGANRFTNAKMGPKYSRGQEMGYFAYGGSTVIAVFPPEAKVKWDDDLKANSDKGIETLVKVNERIGISEA